MVRALRNETATWHAFKQYLHTHYSPALRNETVTWHTFKQYLHTHYSPAIGKYYIKEGQRVETQSNSVDTRRRRIQAKMPKGPWNS